jgi:hypothetical protein
MPQMNYELSRLISSTKSTSKSNDGLRDHVMYPYDQIANEGAVEKSLAKKQNAVNNLRSLFALKFRQHFGQEKLSKHHFHNLLNASRLSNGLNRTLMSFFGFLEPAVKFSKSLQIGLTGTTTVVFTDTEFFEEIPKYLHQNLYSNQISQYIQNIYIKAPEFDFIYSELAPGTVSMSYSPRIQFRQQCKSLLNS